MKSKTFTWAAVFVVILSITFFVVMPASASTVSINWGDSFIGFGTLDTSPDGVVSISFDSGVSIADSSAPSAHNPIPTTLLLLASGLTGVAVIRKKLRR